MRNAAAAYRQTSEHGFKSTMQADRLKAEQAKSGLDEETFYRKAAYQAQLDRQEMMYRGEQNALEDVEDRIAAIQMQDWTIRAKQWETEASMAQLNKQPIPPRPAIRPIEEITGSEGIPQKRETENMPALPPAPAVPSRTTGSAAPTPVAAVGDLDKDGTPNTAADQQIATAQKMLLRVSEKFPGMKQAEIELRLLPRDLRQYRRAIEIMGTVK
jgi:hypothetical protein